MPDTTTNSTHNKSTTQIIEDDPRAILYKMLTGLVKKYPGYYFLKST
jgi:hypothetical protein